MTETTAPDVANDALGFLFEAWKPTGDGNMGATIRVQHLKTDETTTFKLLWSPPLKAHNNNKAERLRGVGHRSSRARRRAET